MNIPIKNKTDVAIPPKGYVFPFIDEEDMQLKAKLSDGIVINYGNVDTELKNLSLTEYTAFEVMPNKTVITSGTVDEVTGLKYNQDIPACTEHKMTICSSHSIEKNDIIIDWGDGVVEAIEEGKYNWTGKDYELSHDYSDKMTKNIQKFVVKIYGKDFYTFRHEKYQNNNLICRIFENDLPISNHITNFASICFGAIRLIKISIPHSSNYVTRAFNFSSAFECCYNLVSVLGFEDSPLQDECLVSNIYNNCVSLRETDWTIPNAVTSIAGIFLNCRMLNKDIAKIIPNNGFSLNNIYVGNAFENTESLTGIVPDMVLWNSGKTFLGLNTLSAFKNSGVSQQVPKSWGGLADDSVIKQSFEDRISKLETRILALENTSLMLE